MSDALTVLTVEERPGWEQQQQLLEHRRWQEEREAQGLAIRVARELIAISGAEWLTRGAASAYRRSAEILLTEAEKLGN
jgi:hypothetical protein